MPVERDIDLFAEFADIVEDDRLNTELMERRRQRVDEENRLVVALGTRAVTEGMDRTGLVTKVWGTVARHRSLMKAAGGILPGVEGPKEAITGLCVRSRSIAIAGDMALSLTQESPFMSTGLVFRDLLETDGLERALDEVVSPATIKVNLIDRVSARIVYSSALRPTQSCYYDPSFESEWARAMFPFGASVFQAPHHATSPEEEQSLVETMSDKQLIIGAGYDARFNLMLDQFADALPR